MDRIADVCLIIEGGYPYELGGVASWVDALIRTCSDLTFHVVAISIASQPRIAEFVAPDNLMGVTDVILDACPAGRPGRRGDEIDIALAVRLMQSALADGSEAGSLR